MNAPDKIMSRTDSEEASAGIITPPSADCDMCSKIMDMFQIPFDEENRIYLGKVGDLLVYNCPHTNWLRHMKYSSGTVPFYEKRDLTLYKWKHSRELFLGLNYITKSASVWSTSRDFELVSRPGIHEHRGTVRVLDDGWVDPELIKEWPTRCTEFHGEKCDETVGDLQPFKPMLLVDVVKGCVVVCEEESPRFITLSYTWGQTKNFRAMKSNVEQLKKPGALRDADVVSQLPKTILDAIELTRALGEAWLWIDSLCIIQDDEEGLAHELAEMHRIYATSFLTIIAADGQDAEHGLRGLKGISLERAFNQTVVPLARNERIAWKEPDPNYRPDNERTYYQRMWTSQEQDFSKRRLLFKSGTVEWECNCALWSEDHLYHSEADKPSTRGLRSYFGRGIHSHVPSLNTLSNLTRSFNAKNLRFEEDVFNAFAGYSTYLNSIFPGGLIYGHPQLFFDISLCWSPINSVRRREISKYYAGHPTHTGLPSWSWMGWQGETTFPWDLESEYVSSRELGFIDTVTEWYAMENPRSTERQRIKSTWSQYRNAAPESMADTWRCTEFKPPATLYRNTINPLSEPGFMPKELPTYIYTHISDGDQEPLTRWYPIPMEKTSSEGGSEHVLHGRYQYLWCQTFRGYLLASPDLISEFAGRSHVHTLKDINGTTVGALDLHNEDDDKLFQEEIKVELIAVAKGWSTILRRYNLGAPNPDHGILHKDGHLTEQEEEEEKERHDKHFAYYFKKTPWTDEWENSKEDKQDCYHVLWIEWDNGVAYRRAYGFVLANEWERLAEPGKVDITLG